MFRSRITDRQSQIFRSQRKLAAVLERNVGIKFLLEATYTQKSEPATKIRVFVTTCEKNIASKDIEVSTTLPNNIHIHNTIRKSIFL